MPEQIDREVEEQALREAGLLGRGGGMGNALYAIDHASLPAQCFNTMQLIIGGGPFPYAQDGSRFRNRFGDLPSWGASTVFLEFTVPTPGVGNRGARRLVANRRGVLFFTACHYERIQGNMPVDQRRLETARLDEHWRNGFYIVTGMSMDLRDRIAAGIQRLLDAGYGR